MVYIWSSYDMSLIPSIFQCLLCTTSALQTAPADTYRPNTTWTQPAPLKHEVNYLLFNTVRQRDMDFMQWLRRYHVVCCIASCKRKERYSAWCDERYINGSRRGKKKGIKSPSLAATGSGLTQLSTPDLWQLVWCLWARRQDIETDEQDSSLHDHCVCWCKMNV